MIDPVLFFFQHIHQKLRQVIGIGGRADLVADDGETVVGFPQIQHGLDEVLSVYAEHPRDTDDIILIRILLYRKLSLVFTLSVHVQGLHHRIVRLPGPCALSVEHIVRAEIDHGNIQFPAHLRDVLRSVHIYLPADIHLIFRGVHGRPRGAVHHAVRTDFADHLSHRGFVCDIHLVHIHADAFVSPERKLIHHIMPQLSFYTCYQYFHKNLL